MDQLHYRPAPGPEGITPEDRMIFPAPARPVRLRLRFDEDPAPSADPMEDSAMWMDAVLDHAQERIDAMRSLLNDDGDDDGPRAA